MKCVCCRQWLLGVNCRISCKGGAALNFDFFIIISACFHFRLSFQLFNTLIHDLIIFRINISIISEVETTGHAAALQKVGNAFQ